MEGLGRLCLTGGRSHTIEKKCNVRTQEAEEHHSLVNLDHGERWQALLEFLNKLFSCTLAQMKSLSLVVNG